MNEESMQNEALEQNANLPPLEEPEFLAGDPMEALFAELLSEDDAPSLELALEDKAAAEAVPEPVSAPPLELAPGEHDVLGTAGVPEPEELPELVVEQSAEPVMEATAVAAAPEAELEALPEPDFGDLLGLTEPVLEAPTQEIEAVESAVEAPVVEEPVAEESVDEKQVDEKPVGEDPAMAATEALPEADLADLLDIPEPQLEAAAPVHGAEAVDEPAELEWLAESGQAAALDEIIELPETLEFEASAEMFADPPAPAPEPEAIEPAAAVPLAPMPEFFSAPPAAFAPSRAEPEMERSSPPLEDLIRGIDEQLETAAPAAAPVEQPAISHKQFSQLDDYVVFSLSGGDYALPVRDVAEIGRVPSVTKVPNVPEFVRGITNLRGEIVPVLNLPQLLGLQETALTARGRVLFLQSRDHVAASGLLVDEVKGIQRIPSQQLEHVTGLVDDKVTSVLRGVHGRGDRLLNVLDLEQVFRLEEFQKFERR